MKKILTLTFILATFVGFSNNPYGEKDPNEIRFITNNKRTPNLEIQAEARAGAVWQQFLSDNGTWYVSFNEETRWPRTAYGKPIFVSGTNSDQKALTFINEHLSGYNLPLNQLELASVVNGKFSTYVNFSQVYQGIQVLNSRLKVKLTQAGEVIQFKTDVYNIDMSVEPSISLEQALVAGQSGLIGAVTALHPQAELRILPIPINLEMEYHLVYEMEIETISDNGIPGKYVTLVDANTGDVLSRQNLVVHHSAHHKDGNEEKAIAGGPSANVSGTLFEENPLVAPVFNGLPNLELEQGGTTLYTDQDGNITSGVNAGSATVKLSGLWSDVKTNNTTPEFNVNLTNGPNNISFDNDATTQQVSGYYHVNIVHDYMKTKYPSFTGLDSPLQTNVDLNTGDCNAFYNGSSINFYLEANDCTSFATVGDVVYHEYGHGINDRYYQSQGGNFQNGAMGEGYADIWALGITLNPILGEGTSISDPTSSIRRYDINPKVYPIDIVGEVHADGEIIAGAWWDLGQIWGDVQQMMDLYSESFNATITGPNGDEGAVYVDILVEALQLDDVPSNGGDNDITNGTPNDVDIVTAFGQHGITLLSNATLTHEPILTHNDQQIDVEVDITLVYPWALTDALLYYLVNDASDFIELQLVNTSGNVYQASIPAQSNGNIVSYYMALVNLDGTLAGVNPLGSDLDPYPNIPHYILVGYETVLFEDFDNQQGNWTEGIPSDNATTGQWIIDIPIGSFSDDGVMVQTDEDATPGANNIACAVTGNATTPSAGIGESDVDGGKTTLVSPVFDLSQYDDPAVTYYRYYTNSPPSGANPGADWWQVELTSDGSNWVSFENTLTSDKSWRRVAFRVADYVDVTSSFQMRFVASDSLHVGQNLDGGSLIEAAVDELYIYEQAEDVSVLEFEGINGIQLFPNPSTTKITVALDVNEAQNIDLRVLDMTGRTVIIRTALQLGVGGQRIQVAVNSLSPGTYLMQLKNEKGMYQEQFTVVK